MAPLALADIYSGSCYKAGLEFKVTGQWALGIEGGGYFRKFNGLQNIKRHLSDLTIRYYLQGKNENGGLYFSINYTYKEQSFSYKDTIQEATPYLLKYRTRKYINCINLNVGLYSRTKSKLLFDIFGGMGVRIKNVHSTMTDSQFDKAKEYNDSQSLYFMVTPGKFVWPNLNFGLRVAYVLY